MVKFEAFLRDTVMVGGMDAARTVSVPNRLEFDIVGVPCTLVNAVRRSIIADVETVAIAFDATDPTGQDIRFRRNTGALHNEFVGERVGLLPLHLTPSQIRDFVPADYAFELDVENKTPKPRDITTKDISITGPAGDRALQRDTVFPPDPVTGDHTLLARLKPQTKGLQEALSFRATARRGTGEEHVRWSPVSNCVCFPVADADKVSQARAAFQGDSARFEAIEKNHCFAKDDNGVALHTHFTIESCCGMTPAQIFDTGLKRLARRFNDLAEATDRMRVVHTDADPGGQANTVVTLSIQGENDTLAAPLQDWINNNPPEEVAWFGYHIPHLLHKSVAAKLALTPGSTADASKIVGDACRALAKQVEIMQKTWEAVN